MEWNEMGSNHSATSPTRTILMALGIHSYVPEFKVQHRIAEVAARQSLPKESLLNYLLFICRNLRECWHQGVDATRLQKGINEISQALPSIYLQIMNASLWNDDLQLSYGGQVVRLREVGDNIEVFAAGSSKPYMLPNQSFANLAATIRADVLDEKNIDIYSLDTRVKFQAISDAQNKYHVIPNQDGNFELNDHDLRY